MTTEAFINPQLVTWALRRSGLTQVDAAKRLQIPQTRLADWERGDARPTFRKAEGLAHVLHIPFGFLFLPEPPLLEIPLPDLRTVNGAPLREFTPEFYDVLNDALRKQEWYRAYLESEGTKPLPFIGQFTPNHSVHMIASEIDNTMGLSEEIRRKADNWEEFLKDFITQVEEIGVLVLRSSVVGNNTHRPLSVDEFRGFVISDEIAPLIFLNGSDAKSAQIFTLAHELAHLWVGQSGISNPDYRRRAVDQTHEIERVCDSIAAQLLVPEHDFLAWWDANAPLQFNIDRLTQRYKVSRVVVLRRAYGLERISYDEYQDYYLGLSGPGTERGGGGNFYRNLLVRNSRTLATAVVGAVLQGRVSDQIGASLLNIQIPTFRNFMEFVVTNNR